MKEALKIIIGKETYRDLEILKKSGLLKNFYLAGGTGAALSLKHRLSKDLDFFSQKPFNRILFLKKISKSGKFELEKQEPGTIIGLFNKTRVSFFYYPYPLLKKPQTIYGVKTASLADIACMKIDAVSSRGSKKDFIDLYVIIQRGYSLKKLLAFFKKKYAGIRYNMIHIKKGLVYFKDAEVEKTPTLLLPVNWPSVKKFFFDKVRELGIKS